MKTLNKMVSSLVIMGTIISTSAVALAAETKTESGEKSSGNRYNIAGKMIRGKDNGNFEKDIIKKNIEEELKTLVSVGIISQEESDKILALANQEAEARKAELEKVKNMTDEERKTYFDSIKEKGAEKKDDIFTKAVSSGIITQEKADSAKTKLKESREAERKSKLTEGLSSLINSGTITQEQSDKIVAYLNTLEAKKTASDTTQSADSKKERKNPLSSLVDDGTLSQEQLDALSKVLPMGKGHGHGGR